MTLKRKPNGNLDDYYISGYTLEMNNHHRLDYYPVGSFPKEKLRALQLEDPMGGMIIKYLKEQILPEEKRMRERVYKSENNFLIDENSHLLYHVELVV